MALFAGDGSALVVSLSPSPTSPPLFIAARTLSPTEGKLVFWRPDLELDHAPRSAACASRTTAVAWCSGSSRALMSAGDCPLQEFVGRFAGMAAADGPPAAPRAQPIAAVGVPSL